MRNGKSQIRWSESEWDKLADIVWNMRLSDPSPTLTVLANDAMHQFAQDRRRILQSTMLAPLLERLKEKEKEYRDLVADKQSLHDRLKNIKEAPSKEEILAGLPTDEIIERYKWLILNNLTPDELLKDMSPEVILETLPLAQLVGYVSSRIILSLQETKSPYPIEEQPFKATIAEPISLPRLKKPKVAIFGTLPAQNQEILKALNGKANFNFIDKNRHSNLPAGQDIYFIWARYCSHSLEEQIKSIAGKGTVLRHHGGMTNFIAKLKEVLVDV